MYMYYLKCTAQFDKLMNMFHILPHQLNEHLEREGERGGREEGGEIDHFSKPNYGHQIPY